MFLFIVDHLYWQNDYSRGNYKKWLLLKEITFDTSGYEKTHSYTPYITVRHIIQCTLSSTNIGTCIRLGLSFTLIVGLFSSKSFEATFIENKFNDVEVHCSLRQLYRFNWEVVQV